jgi:hypothetical protein
MCNRASTAQRHQQLPRFPNCEGGDGLWLGMQVGKKEEIISSGEIRDVRYLITLDNVAQSMS